MRTTVLLVTFSTMSVLACGGDDTTSPDTGNGTPTVASVVVTPGNATLVSLGETMQLTASAKDAAGTAVSGKTFSWSSSDPAVATVSSSGLVTAVGNGSATITATTDGKGGTATIAVDQVAVQLAFTVQPGETQLRETIAPAVDVAIQDARGRTVGDATEGVTLAMGNNAGGGTLSGTTTVAAVDGVATFDDLSIDEIGSGYTLVVTSGTLTEASSSLFDIVFTFAAVSTGKEHACGLTTSGTAYCWGDNTEGQLGDASNAASTRPVRVAGGLHFAELTSGGRDHTCGLTDQGEAYCWGWNPFGQLGDGTMTNRNVPVRAAGSLTFTTLDAGPYHTCGLTSTGGAYCWGANRPENRTFSGVEQDGFGLGAPTSEFCDNPVTYRGSPWPCSPTPLAVSGGMSFRSISAGLWATCGVTLTGEAYCWGLNFNDQLGNGTSTGAETPTPVAGGLVFDELALGVLHGCGVVGQDAHCWGALQLNWGQLGTGNFDPSSSPAPVVGGLSFSVVTPSDANSIWTFTCGLTTEGAAYCWGLNSHGQLGTDAAVGSDCPVDTGSGPTTPCSNVPLPVAGGIAFASLATSHHFACGVGQNGAAFCWGQNDNGQFGDGTTTDSNVPVRVGLP